jgi:adenine deaminase
VIVFVHVREDQNEHGYIDTSIAGIFSDQQAAANAEALQRLRAAAAGFTIEDEDCSDSA